MEEEIVGYFLKVGNSEKSIRNNFKIWMITYAPSSELVVKKWYDNFIASPENFKIGYLKLVTQLIQSKICNLKISPTMFFESIKKAFEHVSNLACSFMLLNTIIQVTSEWHYKNIFTRIQVKELQDLIISKNPNNSGKEYYSNMTFPLRIYTHKRQLGCTGEKNLETPTVTKQNFTILQNHIALLKSLVIDLQVNYTEEKYYSVKAFFEAALQNLDDITEENNSTLEVNRNFLALMHNFIKNLQPDKR